MLFNVKSDTDFTLAFPIKKIVNAGWVGRDKKSLMEHIRELEEEGVPGPTEVPICFPMLADRITQSEEIEVLDETDSSGEAEYVLLFHKGETYVTTGCDHTERKLEVLGVPKSKVFYPDVISRDAWRLSDVSDHWDELVLRSWTEQEGEQRIYQEENLTSIINYKELIAFVKKHLQNPDDLEGTIIFSGTIPGKTPIRYSPYWNVELEDPKRKRSLKLFYKCVPTNRWFKP
jgi:hypothetical protein